MIKGKSIQQLAAELQDRADNKADYVADTRDMSLSDNVLSFGEHAFSVNDVAHGQIATKTGIPKRYYDKMRSDAGTLLESNVNHWFQNDPSRRMVRTLYGNARAFLSDRYHRIDNETIAAAVLPELIPNGFELVSSEITDTNMYIQAKLPRIEGEVKVGDVVQGGIIIRNSEVGFGSLDIQPLVYRLVCLNGMVAAKSITDARMRRTHLGAQVQSNDHIVYSDETNNAMDRSLLLQVRDTVRQISDADNFNALLERMREATEGPQAERPKQAVEALGKAYQLSQSEIDGVLESFIRDQDYSRWGMLNAVTQQANKHESYDRAVELETLGGNLLAMPMRDWNRIAVAA